MLIQAFVAQPELATLPERMLHRFARVNEIQSHMVPRRLNIQRRARELGPVVQPHNRGIPTFVHRPFQKFHHHRPGHRCVSLQP